MRVEYEASDKKQGMSLAELVKAVQTAEGLAEANGTNPADSKVKVFVNMNAGIKQIIMEV